MVILGVSEIQQNWEEERPILVHDELFVDLAIYLGL